jgi:hypothetical protein
VKAPEEPATGPSTNWLAVASLVCSVFGLVMILLVFVLPYIGLLFCLPAIGLGIAGIRDARRFGGGRVAAAGIALGSSGVVLLAIDTAVAVGSRIR